MRRLLWFFSMALQPIITTKQLFGTQFSKDNAGPFCLQPIEKTFPDNLRVQYLKLTLKNYIPFVLKLIASNQKIVLSQSADASGTQTTVEMTEGQQGSAPFFKAAFTSTRL